MGKPARILIVDDDQKILESMKTLLQYKGYEIETTSSPKEALTYLNQDIFDLALLDVMMPEMTGFELLDSLDRANLGTMFMIMTGEASMEYAIEAVRKMANDYIRKPCEPDELLMRVELALKQKRIKDEIKTVEEEKKSLEKQLQHSQKMETIGTLAGGIAHDFNNMLCIIIGSAELALASAAHDGPAGEYLSKILTASTRAEEMVRRLLSFSRLAVSEKEPVDLNSLLDESLKLLSASFQKKIEIRRQLCDTALPIMGNSTQINQVIINLCNNAAHAMETSGGILEVALDQVTLNEKQGRFAELDPGEYARLSVSDTGHGIDPGIMQRIFDPYFTTKEPGKGTGMGLAMVHGIVKNHGGGIQVKSEVERGAQFDIFLPIIAADVSEAAAPLKKASPKGRESILLVDDEEMVTDMTQVMLEELGYQVTAFSQSQKAFEEFSLRPFKYDLMITDMVMPEMAGDILAAKSRAIRADIPIIMSTGYNEKIDIVKAASFGNMEIMMKPFRMNTFAETLRKLLDPGAGRKRMSTRYLVNGKAFVAPNADPKVRFDIIDISEKGLAFKYYRTGTPLDEFEKLSIVTSDEKIVLEDIGYKLVSDIELIEKSETRDAPIRRRGIQFESLTPMHHKMLGYLIQNHTAGALN
jgi:signal transduction histidine kinase